MEEYFRVETTRRKVKCGCGTVMDKDTKQLKVLSSASRYGISYSFLCHRCADKELGILNVKLDKLKRSI